MKRLQKNLNSIGGLLLVVLIVIFIAYTSQKLTYGVQNQYSGKTQIINEHFVQVTSDGIFSVEIPGYLEAMDGTVLIKTSVTDQLIDGGGIGFYSINSYVQAYLDDRLIYSNYNFEKYGYTVEVGNVWNHFELKPHLNDEKELIIKFSSLNKGGHIKVGNIYSGDQQDIFSLTLKMDYYMYAIMLLLQVLGYFVLFFRYAYRKKIAINPSVGMLGIGAILASAVVFTFSNMVTFDFMSGYMLKVMAYSTILLCSVAVVGYVVQLDFLPKRKPLLVLMGICILWAVGFAVSHIFYPRLFGFWTYVFFSVLFIGLIGDCILQLSEAYVRGNSGVRVLLWSLLFLFITVLADIALNLSTNIDGLLFSLIGVAIFFLSNSVYEIQSTSNHYEWAERMNYYKELARTDQMTGLKNRVCFVEDSYRYNNQPEGLSTVSFDVDNLKSVNDNYGHSMGDDMIVTAARLIQSSFGRICQCYRMSGDEFLCIGYLETEKLEEMLKQFRESVLEADESKNYRFRVSAGVAVFDSRQDSSIEDMLSRAEKAMYQDKRSAKVFRRF